MYFKNMHLLIKNGKVLLIDPPYVHGIEKAILLMGRPEAIIITTADQIVLAYTLYGII